MAELTPMMQQYIETKKQYQDCILFYRLGDFYEMFFEDALTASRELEITLTGKNCGQEEKAPMCGVPYHAVEGYLNKLVSKGYKVAICEQVEDPKQAKGIVKREVVRIVTPGTNLDTQALDETKNNYIMCIVYIADRYGLSIADVTTGDYFVTELEESAKLLDEIYRFMPSEIICNESYYMSGMDLDDLKDRLGITIYSLDSWYFDDAVCRQVPEEIVKDRFDRLLKEVQSISAEVCSVHTKTVQRVLVESVNDHDDSLVTGRMSNNLLVHFPGEKDLVGKLVDVRLDTCKGFYYLGEMVASIRV